MACMGDSRDVGRVLGKTDRKRRVGRLEEMLQLFFERTGRNGADWIDLAQDRDQIRTVVNAAVNIRVTRNAWHFYTN
jgi:hypothetical protein